MSKRRENDLKRCNNRRRRGETFLLMEKTGRKGKEESKTENTGTRKKGRQN